MEDKGSRVLILAGSSLQYWSFPHNEQEKMEFDEDIGHIISQIFQRVCYYKQIGTIHSVALIKTITLGIK